MVKEAEELIEAYREWLNKAIDASDQEGVIPHATREMFDEFDDPPRILLDHITLPGKFYARRYLVIICSPFHDEGGPTILTGIYVPDYDDDTWILDEAIAEFDTDFTRIWHNRKPAGFDSSADQDS